MKLPLNRHPAAVAHAVVAKPMRPSRFAFDIFTESGLLRAQLVPEPYRAGCLWKLDELHEALILEVLRQKRKALKANLKCAELLGETYRVDALLSEIGLVNDALIEVGNRREVVV